ncbi:endonuclease/exonuclease/phosphatase family protein [Dyadobacter sp. 676]|uniref:Endonuclease/exonuclease/phosphatase family protein n=1 Tax=Dyadobacter sp. 676 TaxID=3088362 RepID=A0AAU8FG07_9BACT
MIFSLHRLFLNLFPSALTAVLLHTTAFAQPDGAATRRLKVMTYNIRIASPPSKGWGYTDLPAIAAVISREQPDLVALQEVDAFTDRSGKQSHQARELGKLTGMQYHFAKAIGRSNGDYGVAVLSRYPIEKAESFRLSTVSGHPEAETRAAAVVTVRTPMGRVVFISAHLDHLSDADRSHQIGQLNKILHRYRKRSVILGADLNAVPNNPVISQLEAGSALHRLPAYIPRRSPRPHARLPDAEQARRENI